MRGCAVAPSPNWKGDPMSKRIEAMREDDSRAPADYSPAIDLLGESPRLSLTELARREGVAVSTCWRWALKGVRGVRLETFNLGGKRMTTDPAFRRFATGTTAAAAPATSSATLRTTRQREAAIARAEAELAKAGV